MKRSSSKNFLSRDCSQVESRPAASSQRCPFQPGAKLGPEKGPGAEAAPHAKQASEGISHTEYCFPRFWGKMSPKHTFYRNLPHSLLSENLHTGRLLLVGEVTDCTEFLLRERLGCSSNSPRVYPSHCTSVASIILFIFPTKSAQGMKLPDLVIFKHRAAPRRQVPGPTLTTGFHRQLHLL